MILEIRVYQLHPGVRPAFHQLFEDEIRPLSARYDIDVVRAGPSVGDEDSYTLIRSFVSLEARDKQKDAFYGGPEWLGGLEERVMGMIAAYQTAVIVVDSADDLRG
ncbi:NIPSNAP family protein [Longispora sp. K20-0274]|uniref:NIPSNAP family protein n=1 Tax=Longispora sp. K20-0274 TaxID=3088255 RepID=UPI00399BEF5B